MRSAKRGTRTKRNREARSPLGDPRDAVLALSTAPDTAIGEQLASVLVEERLAACVNVVPGLASIYRWKGRVERSSEVLCILKTRRPLLKHLTKRLAELHPYEVPELLVLPVAAGARSYLAWLREETRSSPRSKRK
jgi:periplasmic divalent cation tolerance protein